MCLSVSSLLLGSYMNATYCSLSSGRTLHSALLQPSAYECARPVFHDVASADLAVVVTYSAGSLAAQRGFNELRALQTMLVAHAGKSRAVLVGKGSRCLSSAKLPLFDWAIQGKAHCIQGPNVGAREAHTIWAFMHDFYNHLPRVALFVQDDPSLFTIRKELIVARTTSWAKALEDSFAARAQLRGSSSSSWVPAACACVTVREAFSAASYGGYRPMHWWMRSFLAPYANGSRAPLPDRIAWPSTAQFALPRSAIRARSRSFIHLNVRLTEVPAPLKSNVPRRLGTSDDLHKRTAKWANFGPAVVDLGEAPPRGRGHADVRPWINGMDFAQASPELEPLAAEPPFPCVVSAAVSSRDRPRLSPLAALRAELVPSIRPRDARSAATLPRVLCGRGDCQEPDPLRGRGVPVPQPRGEPPHWRLRGLGCRRAHAGSQRLAVRPLPGAAVLGRRVPSGK